MVLKDDLGGITRWLGGYYKMTWGVLQDGLGGSTGKLGGGVYKITWGILQNDLGGITRWLGG